MQSCVQVFEDVVDSKCAAGGGSAKLDFHSIFANLTSVSNIVNFHAKGY